MDLLGQVVEIGEMSGGNFSRNRRIPQYPDETNLLHVRAESSKNCLSIDHLVRPQRVLISSCGVSWGREGDDLAARAARAPYRRGDSSAGVDH